MKCDFYVYKYKIKYRIIIIYEYRVDMESRVKIYKKYREQIQKEADLNNKLKYKNKDILSIEKKMSRFNISNDDDLLISNVNSIKPKALLDIKKINEFCDSIPANNILDDFKNIEINNGIIEHIIDKDGEINKFFLENNDQFKEITTVIQNLYKKEHEIDILNTNLKDNNNTENNLIHEMKSSDDIDTFIGLSMNSSNFNRSFFWARYIFFGFIILFIISFILIMVFLFV